MHCFYIGRIEDGGAYLLPDEAKHAKKVLRLGPGDEVCAMDGAGGRWRAAIRFTGEDGVWVDFLEPLDSHEPPARVTVYQGVPKADKLDFVVQKLTETGASALIPVKMSRCVAKPDAKDARKRRERLERIAREAAKQCNRGRAPEILEPLTWTRALAAMARHDLVLVPWEEADGFRMKDAFAANPGARDIGIVIGPEGGMSAEEVDAMLDAGAKAITLGPRILRTETAAVVSAALAMSLWGDI